MAVPPPPPDKPALRATMRARRAAFVAGLAPGARAALEGALAERLRVHLPGGCALATYAPMGAEIDPAGADALGRPLLFPRVEAPDRPLSFRVASRAELVPGFARIPEPPPAAQAVEPAVILVPLLAVDRAGNRLGQGGGFYDRTLAALAGRVPLIGVAWDCQLVDALRPEPWDVPLDAVATPQAWIVCGPRAISPP